MNLLTWFKSKFKKKTNLAQGEVAIHFILPNGKKFDVIAIDPKLMKEGK